MNNELLPVAILTAKGRVPGAKRVASLLTRCDLRTRVFTDPVAADRWEQSHAIAIEYGVSTSGWEDEDWDRWARITREWPAKDWAMWAGEIEYQRRKRWRREHGDHWGKDVDHYQRRLKERREKRRAQPKGKP